MLALRPDDQETTILSDDGGPKIIFLGLYERAAYVQDGNTNLFKWNVLGLKNVVVSHIFPLPLTGFGLAFAVSVDSSGHQHAFRFTDELGNEVGTFNMATVEASPSDDDALLKRDAPMLRVPPYGWIPAFVCPQDWKLFISSPGVYYLKRATDHGEEIVGELQFALLDAPPLTLERIAAIRSDPYATKSVRLEFACNACGSKCRAYAALEQNHESEAQGWRWYRDLPDTFICECGRTRLSLETIRRNLHGLLGRRHQDTDEVTFVPLYERSSLVTIRTAFARLLESRPKEELLQQFFQENPILFHQFPSHRLIPKPPILTSFVADFALVTPQRELLLVELEKTTTRLLKRDGGMAADLSHAFDQARDWLHVADEHRLALLDSLKIDRQDVSTIRGVVIAGRDVGYDAHQLRKLKGTDFGRVTLLTYDDLFFALDALIRKMDSL